jgi:hypothetical protein
MSEVTYREGFHPHGPLAIVRLAAPEAVGFAVSLPRNC